MKTGCLGHSFWAPFIQDTLRQQTFFAFLLPSSKHQLGVHGGVWFLLTFSESSLTRRLNESSVHCLSGLSCAALYANPHTLKLGDKCEPHALWISFFRSIFLCFFCLFSDRSCTIGIAFYVITSPVKKHWSFPNICFLYWSIHMLHLLTVNHAQPSSEVGRYASHLMLAHSSKLSLYMLHHCDKYPAYLRGLSTWGVNNRLERNRLTCTYNNGAEGVVVNHWGSLA